MKRLIITFTVITILLTACIATPNPDSQPNTTPMVSTQGIAPAMSTPTEQISPAKKPKTENTQPVPQTTDKPKGREPLPKPTSPNLDFIASEILGRPTDISVTINVVPAVTMDIYYEYGTVSGTYTTQTDPQTAAAGVPIETVISGLQPNTRYYYRLHYNGDSGQEHTFMTQRAPGSTFMFAIQGDSHPERVGKQFNADLYSHTLQSVASDQPDFYMTIGDDFSVDILKTVNPETVKELYINQRQWLGLVGSPVFLVNGNHEQASLANIDGSPDNVAVWAQTSRNTYYPQPAPLAEPGSTAFYTGDVESVKYIGLLRDYYAFTWGDALFVVIDPYWHSPQTVDNRFGAERDEKKKRDLWDVTLGDVQYQWFRHTLETSSAKYKFVFTHHVNGTGRGGTELANTFEWGDAVNLGAHRPGWDKTIHQLMVDNHVTIFFQGHDHIFVRQELDGVIYQTLPEPANPNYTYENENAYQSGDKFPNSGYVRVTVSPVSVQVDYVRSYLDKPDELAFSYTVK
jgi:hypothetical protein